MVDGFLFVAFLCFSRRKYIAKVSPLHLMKTNYFHNAGNELDHKSTLCLLKKRNFRNFRNINYRLGFGVILNIVKALDNNCR